MTTAPARRRRRCRYPALPRFGADRLAPAEMAGLFALRDTDGWPAARERLILGNLGLAGRVARRADRLHRLGFDEFRAAAIVGVVEAVDSYDPAHPSGATFSTWATWKIRRAILSHARYPLRHGTCRGASLLEPMPLDGLRAPAAGDRDALADLRAALDGLDPEARRVLSLRFGLDGGGPQSPAAIGRRLGITRSRAETLCNQALATLRETA